MTWLVPALFTLALLGPAPEAAEPSEPPVDKCEPKKNEPAKDTRRGPVSFPGSVDANTVPPVPANPPREPLGQWTPLHP
jgi:hypothetical protein